MIKISTRVLYGLRAIIYMGLNKDRWPIPLSEIANRQNIPLRYIEQIFIRFKKSGIVKSIRGVKGGYVLREGYENISLLDIVEAADNRITLVWCLTPTSKRKCPIVGECMLADIWSNLVENIRSYLSGISLKSLLEEANRTKFAELMEKVSTGNYQGENIY